MEPSEEVPNQFHHYHSPINVMSDEEINNIFTNVQGKGVFVVVGYRRLMGTLAGAVALSQLVYWGHKKTRFWKTDAELMEETGLSEKEWRLAKCRLKTIPFLKITVEGIPPKTWYEFEPRAWLRAQTISPKGPDCSRPKGSHNIAQRAELSLSPKTTSENTTLTGTKAPSEGVATAGLHPKWTLYATKLHNAINKVRSTGKVNITTWAMAIRKLNTVNGFHCHHIRDVLDWYCKTLEQEGDLILNNPHYIPIAYSGQAFKDKFTLIEQARDRRKPPPPKEPKLTGDELDFHNRLVKMLQNNGVIVKGSKTFVDKVLTKVQEMKKAAKAIIKQQNIKWEKEQAETGLRTTEIGGAFQQAEHVLTFSVHNYTMWIVAQTEGWKDWSGDMREFNPGGKHWQRYMEVFRRQYCSNDWRKELWSVLNEA